MQVDAELKSGRVVVDETRITAASAQSVPNAAPVTPPPPGLAAPPYLPPGAPAAMPPGMTPVGMPGQPLPPGYPSLAGQPLPLGFPQPTPPGTPGMVAGFPSGPQPAPTLARPTRESPPVAKARRVRSVLAAVAGALVVVIALLAYFLLSQPPPKPPPPPPKVEPKIEPKPVTPVEAPPKPPEPTEPPPVTVTIASRPPGAEVVVDGETKGETPLRLTHKSGAPLHMELRKKGFEPYSEDLQPEKDLNVDIKLDKEQRGGKRPSGTKAGKGGKGPGGSSRNPPGVLPSELRDPFKRKG
jgi:hypothetical protein